MQMLFLLRLCFSADVDSLFDNLKFFSQNMLILNDNIVALNELENNLKKAKASEKTSIQIIDSLVKTFQKAVPYEEITLEIKQWEIEIRKLDEEMNLILDKDVSGLCKNYEIVKFQTLKNFFKNVSQLKSDFYKFDEDEKRRMILKFYDQIEKTFREYMDKVRLSKHFLRLSIEFRLLIKNVYQKKENQKISQIDTLKICSKIIEETIEKQKKEISKQNLNAFDDVDKSSKIYFNFLDEIGALKVLILNIYAFIEIEPLRNNLNDLIESQIDNLINFSNQINDFAKKYPLKIVEERYKKEFDECIENLQKKSEDLIEKAVKILNEKILDEDYYKVQLSSTENESERYLNNEINRVKEKISNSKETMKVLIKILETLNENYRDEYLKMKSLNWYFASHSDRILFERIKLIFAPIQPEKTKKFFTLFRYYFLTEIENFFYKIEKRNVDDLNEYLDKLKNCSNENMYNSVLSWKMRKFCLTLN